MVRWIWRSEWERMKHKLNYWIHSSSTHAYLPHFIAFLSPFACTNGMKLMEDENQNILFGIRVHIGLVSYFFFHSLIFFHSLYIYLDGRLILSDSIWKSVYVYMYHFLYIAMLSISPCFSIITLCLTLGSEMVPLIFWFGIYLS